MAPRTSDTSDAPALRPEAHAHQRAGTYPAPGLRIGRLFGIELYLDWSIAIIFFLVAFGLGAGALPRWHPEWIPALRWTVAIAAAVAFFVSILLHELSHA